MARERLPKRTPEEERATAIREAGHAVIARVLGLVCGNVTIGVNYRTRTSGYGIIADPRVANDCWEQRGRYRPLEAAFRGRILAYMAGRGGRRGAVRLLPGRECGRSVPDCADADGSISRRRPAS